uniref:GYF domain-containing protein n=1 Tax=Timema cristinae TaxID=61476 RepID=A0A7R9CRD9_TIMCR|nr:unnamed protein product [Timema cristinae]
MPKRKLEEELEIDWSASDKKLKAEAELKKNSLDSDEEDDAVGTAYDVLADDDIEGQEDGVAGFDGETQITPFNMKEELEEGHFDTDGNYHWAKDKRELRDNWLENIDWFQKTQNVYFLFQIKPVKVTEADSDSTESEGTPFDPVPAYRQMLELMKPGETVAKAIRRLGGNKPLTASERWKRKKAGQEETDQSPTDKEKVTQLTELANRVLTEMGNMDIYQESYEYISSIVNNADKKSTQSNNRTEAVTLDMYADDFDEKEKARLSEITQKENQDPDTAGGSRERIGASPPTTTEHSVEVQGPHPSSQMNSWVEDGKFSEPVWVRRQGQGGSFYSSRRIDFELYM